MVIENGRLELLGYKRFNVIDGNELGGELETLKEKDFNRERNLKNIFTNEL